MVVFFKNTKINPFHGVHFSIFNLNINTLQGTKKTLTHSITTEVINHIMIDM
uniref:Uncharacterized protein n=1 Tax=Escherichia coli TaxID=562 RepID=A0A2P9EI26_ECOLX|nr:conserved protein of unknown function [Escherichia coli]